MANEEQNLDLENLKSNPDLWKRLATPTGDGTFLERVFKDDEDNPFEKDGEKNMEKLRKLAAEGQLYMREFGRAAHFRKVEADKDNLKLGDVYQQSLGSNTNFVIGGLLYASSSYFRWIGLGFVANWFDRRIERRKDDIERRAKYRAEQKAQSKVEKKVLKQMEKQRKLEEKARKRLEKAQKELEEAQNKLQELLGNTDPKTKGEMNSPLSEAPPTEDQASMQPNLLGDQPVNQKDPIQTEQENKLNEQPVTDQQTLGTEKKTQENNNQLDSTNRDEPLIDADDVQQGEVDNINQFFNLTDPTVPNPGHEEEGPLIDADEEQAEGTLIDENDFQQGEANNTDQFFDLTNPAVPDPGNQAEGTLIDENDFQQGEVNNVDQFFDLTAPAVPNPDPHVQENAGEVPNAQMQAPLAQPPEAEPDRVSLHEQANDQNRISLEERLAAEKQALDKIHNWKDALANTLFSHDEANMMMQQYRSFKAQSTARSEYVSGAALGVLSQNMDAESRQQVMDALLNGTPLGNEHHDLVTRGMTNFTNAIARKAEGDAEPLGRMLANSIRELSKQASQEPNLSPRLAMVGRLISNAARLGNEYNVKLPLNAEEWKAAQGAINLSVLARGYYEARQSLGKNPASMNTGKGRQEVNTLLLGTAVNKMIQQNQQDGQIIDNITSTQWAMGDEFWGLNNLQKMTSNTETRRTINRNQLEKILDQPDGFEAQKAGLRMSQDLFKQSMGTLVEKDGEVRQREMEAEQNMEAQNRSQQFAPF